jgi:hypothetical protein
MRVRRLDPRDEQRHRALLQYILQSLRVIRRHSKRRHPVEVLALRSKRLAACRNDACCRVGVQQCFGHSCCSVDYMLAIIEHEHYVL